MNTEPVDVTDETIEASNERGELFTELVEQFDEMADEGLDPMGVVYSLWVSFIYVLVEAGWSPQELVKDLTHHAHNHDVQGHG